MRPVLDTGAVAATTGTPVGAVALVVTTAGAAVAIGLVVGTVAATAAGAAVGITVTSGDVVDAGASMLHALKLASSKMMTIVVSRFIRHL
jgi:hypothetical protein